MRQTFCLTFNCRKAKVNRQGVAPVEAILIINGERTTITLTRKEKPSDFERMIKDKKSNDLQDYLEAVRVKINQIQTQLLQDGMKITPITIKEYYKTGGRQTYTLSMMFDEYLSILKRRMEGGDLGKRSYQRYMQVADFFIDMVNVERDMKVEDVTRYHIELFKAELIKKYEPTTVGGIMKKLKPYFDMAFKTGKIKSDPFFGVKIPRQKKEVEFLTVQEVDAIRNLKLDYCERLEKVRDLFLFQTHTGLSYCDMSRLVKADYKTNELGQIYVNKQRGKTGIWFTAVLFGDADRIIKEYDYELPLLSNQKYNSYLKEIADLCNITKPLHTHIARHTCATMLLSEYNVTVEVIQKILGHTNTRQTLEYAKLVDKSVFLAMDKIKTTPA